MAEPTCFYCRHWEQHGIAFSAADPDAPLPESVAASACGPGLGPCRRYPPDLVGQPPLARWPLVHAKRGCGEWEAVPDDPEPDDGERVIPFQPRAAA